MFRSLDRRSFTVSLCVFSSVSAISSATSADGDDTEVVEIEWEIPNGLAALAVSEMGDGVETKEIEGRGAITLIVGAIALVYLARSVIRLREELDGGTVIRKEDGKIKIEKSVELPSGVILVNDKNGMKIYERGDIESPADLVKALK